MPSRPSLHGCRTRHRGCPRRTPIATLSAVGAALAVAACGTPAASVHLAASAAPSTTIPKHHATLTIVDTGTDPGTTREYEALIRLFEREYPQVTIVRKPMAFSNLLASAKLMLSSPSAPDVVEGNQGQSLDGILVKSHLIRAVTPWEKLYGWDPIWPAATQASNKFTTNAAQFGTGTLWGISPRAEILGVFYDKRLFKRLGFSIPHTFAAFESLAAAKRAGQVPIMLGDADNYTGGQVLYELIDHYDNNPQELRDWVYGRAGSTFVQSYTLQGATTLAQWVHAGYFESGFLGIHDQDAQANFAKGQGVFMLTGSFNVGTYQQAMGDNVGFFPLPATVAGGPEYATGSLSPAQHITAQSKNPNVAAAWLNLLVSKQGAETSLKSGALPSRPISPAGIDPQSALASLVGFNDEATAKNWKIPYLDWTTATMGNTVFGDTQNLMAGRETPKALVVAVQHDWAGTFR